MPSVCQVSSIRTSGASIGSAKWITSSPARALVISRLPIGAPDTKTLRAWTRQPPSTRSARPDPPTQSVPPLDRRTVSVVATRLRSGSTAALAAGW